MRNLDSLNLNFVKPVKVASWGPVLPLFSGVTGWLLAKEAHPAPFSENLLLPVNLLFLVIAVFGFLVPRIFKWGWRSEFFGAPCLYLSSVSLLSIIPCLCIVLYSEISITSRSLILSIYLAFHWSWASKFIAIYKKIRSDSELFSLLYQEDFDVIYYLQRVDEYILEKVFSFRQVPSGFLTVTCLMMSFGATFFFNEIRKATGLPFIHVFLAIAGLPVSLMCIGFATRGWIIFYLLPYTLWRSTGKHVYVDMETVPNEFEKRIRQSKSAARRGDQ